MNSREEELRTYLIGKSISDIEFYSYKEKYISPDHDKTWIITAGFEIKVGDDVFSFCWHPDSEFHDAAKASVLTVLEDEDDVAPLEAKNVATVRSLVGQTIEDIQFEWSSYQEYDENYELKEELSYMPVGFDFKLSEGHRIQLVAASYQLKEEQIEKVIYNPEGNIMVAINGDYQIDFE